MVCRRGYELGYTKGLAGGATVCEPHQEMRAAFLRERYSMHRASLVAGIVLWCYVAGSSGSQVLLAAEEPRSPHAAAARSHAQGEPPQGVASAGEAAASSGQLGQRFGWLLGPLQRRVRWFAEREIVELVTALARGEGLEPGKGWFKGSQTRLDWHWLAGRFDADRDGAVTPSELPPLEGYFARLDRDRDGRIKADDFDWSDNSPYVREMAQARMLFRRADASSNGRVTKQEWQEFFERAAAGKEYITPDDLRAVLFPPQPAAAEEGPSPLVLFKGFVTGELGSVLEGPGIGDYAPQFELRTHDGEESYSLAQFLGQPVVLVFGSFT